jgi:hypothetical protein
MIFIRLYNKFLQKYLGKTHAPKDLDLIALGKTYALLFKIIKLNNK